MVKSFGVWEREVSVDLFGPLPSSNHIMVVQDTASRRSHLLTNEIMHCPGLKVSQEDDDTNHEFLLYLEACNANDFSTSG